MLLRNRCLVATHRSVLAVHAVHAVHTVHAVHAVHAVPAVPGTHVKGLKLTVDEGLYRDLADEIIASVDVRSWGFSLETTIRISQGVVCRRRL